MQNEIISFLRIFSWEKYLKARVSDLELADVGARTFAFAPALEKFFSNFVENTILNGIEIDAYRRFTNLRTRRDYGEFYASQVKRGRYFPQDFLAWKKPLDLVLLLHPFVTREPHENWGLPLKTFKPEKLFQHSRALLKERAGLLLLSSPNMEEFKIAKDLAFQSGFVFLEEGSWFPSKYSIQQQPRLGTLFRI